MGALQGFARRYAMALTLMALAPSMELFAQDTSSVRSVTPQMLRIFIDCHTFCDTPFLQTEVGYVSVVRDREVSDVRVIITSEDTGAGGRAYTLILLGRAAFTRLSDTLTFTTLATDTDDDQRRAQLRYLTSCSLGTACEPGR